MSSDFDPYRQWLGIKSDNRPPDHYELLGLRRFEDRNELIDEASVRRMELLQDIATGSIQVGLSQRILNEISAARICLLNPEERDLYDFSLKRKMVGFESAEERIARTSQPATEFGASVTADPDPEPGIDLANVEYIPVHSPIPTTPSVNRFAKQTGGKPSRKGSRWVRYVVALTVLFAVGVGAVIGTYKFIVPRLEREFSQPNPIVESESANNDLADVSIATDNSPEQDNSGLSHEFLTQLMPPLVREPRPEPSPREPSNDGSNLAKDQVDTSHGNEINNETNVENSVENSVDQERTQTAVTKTPKRVINLIASYDADSGNPKDPELILSPAQQGWTANANPDESDINTGEFDSFNYPAWKNGDRQQDGIDFQLKLTDEHYREMWDRGWQLEIIAKPITGSYLIGWGGKTNSPFFPSDKGHVVVVFAKNAKGDSLVRPGWKTDSVLMPKTSDRFFKVVLAGQPQSHEFTFSAYELDSDLAEKPLVENRRHQFIESKRFSGQIGWTTAGGERKIPKSEILVRRVKLSVLNGPND